MSIETLESIRARVRRAELALKRSVAEGFEESHTLEDGTTHYYSVRGIKSPEHLQDELLVLFLWIWNLQDYLKADFRAANLEPSHIEDVVNKSIALQLVADIANLTKHGSHRNGRSKQFPELTGVGWTIPQSAISKITVADFSVDVDVVKPDEVVLHAIIKLKDGSALDAFEVLSDAMLAWESQVISHLQN